MLNTQPIVWNSGWRASLSRALIVTRRELRDSLRDWRIITPILTLTVVLPAVIVGALRISKDLVERLGPDALDTKILPFGILAVGFFPMSFSLVIALETFVGEKERNSLEALLTAPLTDRELFLGKYLAAVLPPIFTSSAAMAVYLSLVLLTGGPMPASWGLLGIFWLLTVAKAMVMVTGAVIVSSHTTSVRAANLLASFIILPMSVVVQIEAVILLIGQRITMVFIWIALLIVLAILMRTGVRIFNREEIVAREGDTFNIKGVFRSFGRYFKLMPKEALSGQTQSARKFSLWRLYRYDIPQIIVLNKAATLVIGIGVIASTILGWWLSSWQPVQDIVNSRSLSWSEGAANPICTSGVPVTWYWIFFNNTGAILAGSFASLLSLGIAGILLLMVSLGPIGLIGGVFTQLKLNPLPLFFGFVVPHGLIELPAAVIALAAALQMGSSFILPPKGFTVGASLQFSIVNYLKVLALVVPMLFIAALIEGNLTPAFGCWLTGGHF